MKKLFILLLALSSLGISAQKKAKIKGNREVLIKKFDLPDFKEIEIGEKFEIGLSKATDTTRVVIETDENLFDVIEFSVEEDVLRFATNMEIIKKKRMKITVYIPQDFDKIRLKDKGKVYTDEPLALQDLHIESTKKSEAELHLTLKGILEVEASGKSEIKLDAKAEETYIHMTESSWLEAQLETKKTEVVLDDHSEAKLEGSSGMMIAKVQSKAHLKSSDLRVKEAVLDLKDRAVAEVDCSGDLELNLTGESQTYLYGNPKINLKLFKDNAALYKK